MTKITTLLSLAALCCTTAAAIAAPLPAGLPNFATVDPGFYRGAAPTQDGLTNLKQMGVQTVIDLRISPKKVKKESAAVQALGMRFVNIPMGSDPPTPSQEKTFLALVSQAKQHPLYVHCQHGADRTGVMIGLYRRIDEHWTYPRTYAEMRHYGFKPYYTKLAQFVRNAP